MAEISIIRGDSESFECNFTEDGSVIDLTGYTVFFTVKSKDDKESDDSEAKIEKTIDTFTEPGDDPTNGKIFIVLSSEETSITPGTYDWDLQIKSSEGKISSVEKGDFIVLDDVTKRSEAL